MNERIQQLADEAAEFIEAGSGSWTSDIFEQKFAELIVRECALQCNHNDDMDRILEHFGVEQ
jgi:hypothetical protein